MLPFAARQHFLEHGYAVLPNVLSAEMVSRIRTNALSSTLSRSRYFAELPNIQSVLQSEQTMSDPLSHNVMSHLEKRRYILRYYKQVKRQKRKLRLTAKAFLNGRDISRLTGEEMWELSETLSAAAMQVSAKGATNTVLTSTVHTDPQMLLAINAYRANAWMTNSALEAALRDTEALVKPLSQLAEIVGGVERPVIFSDAPLLREAYGNPVGYHCTAPLIGTRTNARMSKGGGDAAAVSLILFTYTPTSTCLAPYVMRNSQRAVQQQYLRHVRAERLHRRFAPMEADVRDQLRFFEFDASVVGEPLIPTKAGLSSSSAPLPSPPASPIGPGSVMVVDPHLMMAFSANLTSQSEVIYRLNIVAENARPYLPAPSWIHGWRTMPQQVNFASPAVFPPLYTP
ncbi:putative mitochondrial hypothetical protein [Leptomonas pyrrhocoris]|uniref:Uncharacterized protein n=1 Tax=Leptomonas pyrrhocoris TaxID=157538 RepID=A0A0N0E0I1_LEPPY|nr:putative mitochondrial hypothetical protein [Leptomonas pyrrhocoris]XP_015664887.1 putative mitochondrial hypothetical protein [Leptomonas pyrrhocoris]KPA86447.1 putative mitochondrial hypothetical protein [Leptomonas pyrrhocoris]KPA86448.1 putative mitochondrial hypothetical protein [Leptomonas pyrrhocoris]|eukprot:XP_015664886.1 putative mitochondrial hypothetical protein [Leptomonas pyrrhocoris]